MDCNQGPDSDKQAFADWVTELHEAFKPHGLLLSAAVSPAKKVVDNGILIMLIFYNQNPAVVGSSIYANPP